MAKQLGSDTVFTVAGTALANIKSVTFGGTVTAVDSTDNDDSGIKTYLAGDEDGTCSVTYHYDPAATQQSTLITNFYAKTTTAFVYRPQGTGSGLYQYTFNGIITGLNFPSTHEVTLEASVDIQITGGVTAATQV
jgi:hypothetical protein